MVEEERVPFHPHRSRLLRDATAAQVPRTDVCAAMLHHVHEMLFIGKGGAEQLPDELAAYTPLIPQGAELVATVMFEIDDPIRRARVLATLGGVEDKSTGSQEAKHRLVLRGFVMMGGVEVRT